MFVSKFCNHSFIFKISVNLVYKDFQKSFLSFLNMYVLHPFTLAW
jgi:hypothetical protein